MILDRNGGIKMKVVLAGAFGHLGGKSKWIY